MIWGRDPKMPLWRQACRVGLVTKIDLCKHSRLGRRSRLSRYGKQVQYSRYSRQCRHSLEWDNKTLTLPCLLEQPVFHFVYIAFTIK